MSTAIASHCPKTFHHLKGSAMRFKIKTAVLSLASLVVVGALAQAVRSDDKPPATPGGMDPAMMAEMMKVAAPGPQHAALKKMAGKFDAEVIMKMSPDAPDMTSKGSETSEMMFGDRYLKSDYTGDMMGQPFKGLSIVGYDNLKKKYVSVWLDDMSTGPMTTEGTSPDDGKTITYTGEMFCPMNGQMMAYRQIIKIDNDDHYQIEMFQKDPTSGKEFRAMVIKYSRVK